LPEVVVTAGGTHEEKEKYDSDAMDEVECPHCAGRGTTGLTQNFCKLCDGDRTVSKDKHAAYVEKYGRP
jgi:DnaJ-class molecular chaperone